ncbi:MAG: hypothetical protein AAGF31_00360 [Planctomycetota bacterium]
MTVSSTKKLAELRRIVSLACDDALDERQKEQIERLLDEDRDLIPYYISMVQVDSLVEQSCGLSVLAPTGLGGESLLDQPHVESPTSEAENSASSRSPESDYVDVAASRHSGARGRRGPKFPKVKTRGFGISITTAAGFLVAASLLIAFGVQVVRWSLPAAHVVAMHAADWGDEGSLEVGSAVRGSWNRLESGTVHLSFRRGAMVAITGPALFRATSPNSCDLVYGSLSAHINEEAVGFRVDTEEASVVDMSTGFRMTVDTDNNVSVHVTKGSVEMMRQGDSTGVELGAGEVGAYAARDASISKAVAEHVRVEGQIVYRETHPASLGYRAFVEDDLINLFLESHRLKLPHDVMLNLVDTGWYDQLGDAAGFAKAGQEVDCYLLHSSPQRRRHVVRGTVKFPRRIVGVICETDRLNATNSSLGSAWSLACMHPERGMESAPDLSSDIISISPDRRTLSVVMRTESIDQLRVLVEAN